MSIFTGAGVALVTPMHADGSVNFDKMKELIEFQIANDTDALWHNRGSIYHVR